MISYKRLWRLAIVGLSLGVASGASADSLTYHAGFEFSGDGAVPPTSPIQPWLVASFLDTGSNEVTLTLSTPNLVAREFVGRWYFNFDSTLSLADLEIDQVGLSSDPQAIDIVKDTDDLKADGDGYFDIRFDFETSNKPSDEVLRFGAAESATFTFTYTGSGDFSVDSFEFISVNGPIGKNGFGTAAHVQGIGTNAGGSGWVAGEVVPPVPVPVPLAAWGGMGLLGGLGLVKRLKVRYHG